MQRTDTLVIGAGQAGLATSQHLSAAGRDHVVVERGRVAERWRSERWESLRLLTPNWMTRLPGWSYRGPEPDGFMTATEVVSFLGGYARSFAAPVREQTTVEVVERHGEGFRIRTDQGTWWARNVVIATGSCDRPLVPALAGAASPAIHQLTANRYRRPDQLPVGGVLVVGASATGVQLAEELARSGRDVTLAVGNHTRLPRRYRGRDVFWWMDRAGTLARTIEEHPDPHAARNAPSLQLVGGPEPRDLDLSTCHRAGVRLAGRLVRLDGGRARFADDLGDSVARAELRMHRTLDGFDRFAAATGLDDGPAPRPDPIAIGSAPATIDLARERITTVLWATGFGRSYPWLRVPVLDASGEIRHRRGVTAATGLYVVGLRFLHRRDSNFIDGVGRDARFVVDHLTGRPVPTGEVAA